MDEVLVAPGNAGTAHEAKCRNAAVAATDIDALVELAKREAVALTAPSHLRAASVQCFNLRLEAATARGAPLA